MRARLLTGVMITVLVLLAMACSTQNVGQLVDNQHGASAFDVSVLPDSYIDGSSAQAYKLSTVDYGEDVMVNIDVTGAKNLKALYFDMKYDAQTYRPIVVDCGKLMGKKADLLCLQLFNEPGTVHYGQVLTNWDFRTGYTGDGTVASVLFKKMPAVVTRNLSVIKPPDTLSSRTTLGWDSGTSTLNWYYYNCGDYNQDSKISIADLSPLGQKFGQSVAPLKYAEGTVMSVIDGNNDGNINIQDLSFIGIHWDKSAGGGYNVYHSANASDWPAAAGDPSVPAMLLGNVAFTSAVGTPADRKRFSYVVAAPVADDYYWVRPNDATTDGISSTLAGGPPATLVLTMTTAAISGTGTAADPYVCDPTLDYQFHLEDATDGDVTATGTYELNPVAAGVFGAGNGLLNIDDAYLGDFTVTGKYNPGTGEIIAVPVITIHIGSGGSDVWIYKDPADADWTPVTGAGSEADPYVLDAADLTRQYSFLASDTTGGGGGSIPVGDLTWDAVPPFITTWTTQGTFEANQFTSGYIVAQKAAVTSNWVYAEIHALP